MINTYYHQIFEFNWLTQCLESPYYWETSAATTAFLTLVDATNDTKMVALSELDKIPDIQNIVNEGAWWLYFCPWYGSFITDGYTNETTLLNTIYNSQYVLTLDEMPFGTNPATAPTTVPTATPTAAPAANLGQVKAHCCWLPL